MNANNRIIKRPSHGFWGLREVYYFKRFGEKGHLFSGFGEKAKSFGGFREQGAEKKHLRQLGDRHYWKKMNRYKKLLEKRMNRYLDN